MLSLCLHGMLGALASAQTAELPPAPADGIMDSTRALTEEARQSLRAGIADLAQRTGIQVWVAAETFLPQGVTARDRARMLRQAWCPTGASAVLFYDRATGKEVVSCSPDLWGRLPASGLFQIHHAVHTRLLDGTVPLEKRLEEGGWILLRGLATLSVQQSRHEQVQTRDFFRLGRAYALVLAAGALACWGVGVWARRRQRLGGVLCRLPRTQVQARLGAPHGSQVVSLGQAGLARVAGGCPLDV